MLDERIFNEIKVNAGSYQYNSFEYLEQEECSKSEVLFCDSELIIVLNKDTVPFQSYFAVNEIKLLIHELTKIEGELQINLVPHEYEEELKSIDFFTWAEFSDYFNKNLCETEIKQREYSQILFSQQKDCNQLSLVLKSCVNYSRGFLGETKEWFSDWINQNDVIIVCEDEKIIGFCCVSIYNNGTTLWIREISVAPDYQGKGYGKNLMEQAICYGRNKGAVKGFLAADVLNENAIKLYREYGFVTSEEAGELQMRRNKVVLQELLENKCVLVSR